MKRVVINASTGLVWIDGVAHPASTSVAHLLEMLIENRDQLVTSAEIEERLNIKTNSRYAYLRDARKLATAAGLRIRSIKGEGVVLEEAELEEVAA